MSTASVSSEAARTVTAHTTAVLTGTRMLGGDLSVLLLKPAVVMDVVDDGRGTPRLA